MHVASHVAHLLADPRVNGLLRPKASVSVETAKFLLEVRQENRRAFRDKLVELGTTRGWQHESCEVSDANEPAHISFAYDAEVALSLAEQTRKLKLASEPTADQLQITAISEDESSEQPELAATMDSVSEV